MNTGEFARGSDSMAANEPSVVTAVLVRDDRALLCHRRADRRWYPDVWDLPGGQVEAREKPADALIRELREELGIGVTELSASSVGSYVPAAELTIDAWIVRGWAGEVCNLAPDEHDQLDWFTIGEIAALPLADPAVGALCALALVSGNRSLRFAGLADADDIAAYHHRCWVESFSDLLGPGVVAAMDPFGKVDRWRSWLTHGSGFTTVVADIDGRSIGHVTVNGHELVHLFIDPDHQGGGLGRSLLAVGEALIAVGRHVTAELQTIVGNQAAIDLYRSAGWTVTDALVHNDHDGVVYDEHVLTKSLWP